MAVVHMVNSSMEASDVPISLSISLCLDLILAVA